MANRPLRFDLYPSAELLAAVDRWRGQQPGVPSRADAARQLLEIALQAEGIIRQPPARKRQKAAAE